MSALAVLVVDDDLVSRRLAAMSLTDEGFRVAEAVDAASGLAAFDRDRFDVVLLDVSMPGMSGFDAVRALRARARRAYVVGYTAHALPKDVASMHAAGFDEVLVKPVGREALAAAVRRGAVP